MTIKSLWLRTTIASLSVALASSAHAATVAALVDGTSIAWIDTDTKAVTKTVSIQGATLVGMDVRPIDKMLYGVASDGRILMIDPATGTTTMKSQISEPLPQGVDMVVDFNPVADRLRVMGSDGSSLRINIEDGKATVDGRLKYGEGDANKGKTAKVTVGAYTNSVAGTKETALYDIDVTNGVLVKQAPPNDGTLNTVGALGITLDGAVAFDIAADGKGGNSAWLMAGSDLYSVDLTSGKATMAAKISGVKGRIIDIAIMPAL
jgi:hypothetical protein